MSTPPATPSQPAEVYIVTKGSYSDYGICAVFLDRAQADEYAAQHGGYEPASVEVWKVGSDLPLPPGYRTYRVCLDEDGSLYGEVAVDEPCRKEPEDIVHYQHADQYWALPIDQRTFVYTGQRTTYVTTDMGKEGALKVATERRARLVAMNQWPRKGEVVPTL